MKKFIIFFALLVAVLFVSAETSFEGHVVIRMQIIDQKAFEIFFTIFPHDSLDVWSNDGAITMNGIMDIRFTPEQYKKFLTVKDLFSSNEARFEVLHYNLQNLLDMEAKQVEAAQAEFDKKLAAVQTAAQKSSLYLSDEYFKSYHKLDQLIEFENELIKAYPNMISKEVIGKSFQGRDLFVYRVHAPGSFDSSKPALFVDSLMHAREWISPPVVQWSMRELLTKYGSDQKITDSLNKANFYALTTVNPDGYVQTSSNRMWRKNMRSDSSGLHGVDLNRNFKSGWGGSGSSGDKRSETYRGTAAISEPEAKAISNFLNGHKDIKGGIDFHSYSELILRPWGKSSSASPNEQVFSQVGAEMQAGMKSVHGKSYSNIRASQLYVASGIFTDELYESHGFQKVAHTVELRPGRFGGGGFVLPPSQIIPTCQENVPVVLTGLKYVSQ